MIDFYKNPLTNDIELDGQNDLMMVEEDQELCQCVADIITTNLGEWIYNPGHGFARFEVLGEKYNREQATDELVAAVLQEPRVASVEQIEWTYDSSKRTLSGSFKFTKHNGQVLEGSF